MAHIFSAPTPVTKRYLRDFAVRLFLFSLILILYLTRRDDLNFVIHGSNFWPVNILWVAMLISMLAQLDPNSSLTTGCLKQFSTKCEAVVDYDPEKLKQAVRNQNIGALKVAVLWLAVNLFLGWLYLKHILDVPELVLLCAFYYLCDLICVLFFCPFQTFLMKNRCCVNCRIFAWGSWMMAIPFLFVRHFFAQTLILASVLVLVVWEVRFLRHPQRFWFGSNQRLQCAHCKDKLCRYKYPRSHS